MKSQDQGKYPFLIRCLLLLLPIDWKQDLIEQSEAFRNEGYSDSEVHRITCLSILDCYRAAFLIFPDLTLSLVRQVNPSFINDFYYIEDKDALERVEKEFREDYFLSSIATIRLSLFLGCFATASFALLDFVCLPKVKTISWVIRFVVCSLGLGVLALSWHPKIFRKYYQQIICIVFGVAGAGLLATIALSSPDEIGYLTYYAGLVLMLNMVYSASRLRFFNALLLGSALVCSYEFVAILSQDPLSSTEKLYIFISNNFILNTANILGIFASNLNERAARLDFLARYVITEKLIELYRYYEHTYPTPTELFQHIKAIRHSQREFRSFILTALTQGNSTSGIKRFPGTDAL